MHRIKVIDFEGGHTRLLPLSFSGGPHNTYTVVVGKNGVGKSKLLSAIVKECTVDSRKPKLKNISYLDNGIGVIIAASTSPFDKFPLPPRNVDYSKTNYRYMGMRSNSLITMSSAVSLISSASRGLLESMALNEDGAKLAEVFSSIHFGPQVEFIFKCSYLDISSARGNTSKLNPSGSDEIAIELIRIAEGYGINLDGKYLGVFLEMQEGERIIVAEAINMLFGISIAGATCVLEVDFSDNYYFFRHHEDKNTQKMIDAVLILLDVGFIRLIDIRLFKDEFGLMSLRRASSGEQCMLALMLGIAGHIRDNSIILIDEPEISLHPKWQEDFMGLLMNAFSSYHGCQFIIATHSPQIVSRLKSDSCYIASLAKNKLYAASEFINRSADYQLAEMFEAPGMMNEYISRLAFNILAKVKSSKSLSDENVLALKHLHKLEENISHDDPLRELIDSVKLVCDYYADN